MNYPARQAGKGILLHPLIVAILDACLVSIVYIYTFGEHQQLSVSWISGVVLQALATVCILWAMDLYDIKAGSMFGFYTLVAGVSAVMFAVTAIALLMGAAPFPDIWRLSAADGFLITIWRLGLRRLASRISTYSLLVIGSRREAGNLMEKESARGMFTVCKTIDTPKTIEDLKQHLSGVDAVLLMPSVKEEKRAQVVAFCQWTGHAVFMVPEFYNIVLSGSRVFRLDDIAVLQIWDFGFNFYQRAEKRMLDVIAAVVGILLFAPFMIICGLLIRITSPGPAIITQSRVGRDHRSYGMYKFRTMVQDAESKTGPVLSRENDPRVTAVGRFLRAARIDELPQLFNVLRGDMSFVGPRPERPVFVEKFNRDYPDYRFRHVVKPGITGLAQISGRYKTTPEDKLRFDLYYIRNYSLLLDIKIIFETIPVLFCKESSAGVKGAFPRDSFPA